MGVKFVGRVTAPRIEPNTPLPYTYTAGESIAAKAPVCKGESDGRIYEAGASAWNRMPAFGIARAAKGAGEIIEVLQFGVATSVQRTEDFSFDDKIYVSESQGKLTNTPPTTIGAIVQSMGRAFNTTDIILEVDQTVIQLNQ